MNVFLSHSYDDNQIAQKVRNYLVHHGLGVFDDKNDIATGANLTASINEAINISDAVLFFISKSSDKSQWVQQEMSLAVSNKFKGKDVKLIPIVIDKSAVVPFFLKDYVYLDMSGSSSFESSMGKLLAGITNEQQTSVEQDLTAKLSSIEIEREYLKLKSLEHEELLKFKTRQMYFVSMIVMIVTIVVTSMVFLGWVAKIDYSDFEWVISFFVGAIASMFAAIAYTNKEKPYREKLIHKIDDLHKSLDKMGVEHDK